MTGLTCSEQLNEFLFIPSMLRHSERQETRIGTSKGQKGCRKIKTSSEASREPHTIK